MTYYEFMNVLKRKEWLHDGACVKLPKVGSIEGTFLIRNSNNSVSMGYMKDGTDQLRMVEVDKMDVNLHWAVKSVFENWLDNK
jgi:hypothetical protein